MKRIIFNLACAIALVAVGFSFWVITSPVTVRAAGASVTCRDNSTITCTAQGEGASCYSHDPDEETAGYCKCTVNGVQTVHKDCPPDDPPILD